MIIKTFLYCVRNSNLNLENPTALILKRLKYFYRKYPRSFGKFVNHNKLNNGIPIHLTFNGVVASCEQEAADMFSSYFSSVYSNITDPSIAFNVISKADDLT